MAQPSPKKDFLSYQKGGPDLAQACLRLGTHKIEEKQFAESLVFAKKAKELGIESPKNDLNIATALMIMGKAKEVEGLCRGVLKIEPENRAAHILLGQARMAQGKYPEAAKSFQSALGLGERDGEVLIEIGLALEADGDAGGAADYFDRAKNDHPGLYEELMDQADLLFNRYLNAATRAVLQKAEKVALRDSTAFYEMGQANYAMGFAEAAEKLFRTSIRLRPIHEAYRDLAELYEKSNQLAKAETFARANLQIVPDEPSSNLILAHCEGRQGRNEEALARFKKILELSDFGPVRIDALNKTGRILDKQGKTDAAYEKFSAAKELLKEQEGFGAVDLKKQHQDLRAMRDMDWSKKAPTPPPFEAGFGPRKLVFFIGFPRSGTTLIQEVLDRHENIVVTPEEPLE